MMREGQGCTAFYPLKVAITAYEGLPLGGQRIRKANHYIWWLAISDD
jgi:hypothetical protein